MTFEVPSSHPPLVFSLQVATDSPWLFISKKIRMNPVTFPPTQMDDIHQSLNVEVGLSWQLLSQQVSINTVIIDSSYCSRFIPVWLLAHALSQLKIFRYHNQQTRKLELCMCTDKCWIHSAAVWKVMSLRALAYVDEQLLWEAEQWLTKHLNKRIWPD